MIKDWTAEQSEVIKCGRDTNLLVSASSGAGKTTVMIARIAKMLCEGAGVGEFLVLTFTNASAADMRSKLRDKVSTDVGQMAVGTFHNFCGDLIRTYFSVVGINPAFAIADEQMVRAIKADLLRDVVDEMAEKCPLAVEAFCNVYGAGRLCEVIEDIAKFLECRVDAEEWTRTVAVAGYEKLAENIAYKAIIGHYSDVGAYFAPLFPPDCICAKWANRLAAVKDYNDLHDIAEGFGGFGRVKEIGTDSPLYHFKNQLSDILKKKICEQYRLPLDAVLKNQERDRELVGQVLDLVREYTRRYREAKGARNLLDFADLEHYTMRILEDEATVGRVREKYKYIFVDEYQDTNAVQEAILRVISKDATIFTVGDVKQSIYAFRGTNSANFTERMEKDKVVYLNDNFRSKTEILEYVNRVFASLMPDYDNGAFKKSGKTGGIVEEIIIEGGTAEVEAAAIAERIGALVSEGVECKHIAILARSTTHFGTLCRVLGMAGIKCTTEKAEKAGDLYEIALLNNVVLAAMGDELAKAKVEASSLFGGLRPPTPPVCGRIDESVVEFLNGVIAEYGVIDKLALGEGGDARVRNVYAFLNKLRGAGYASTVRQYAYMLRNELVDIEIDTSGAGDCVRVMTIHKSKGLEFSVVFLFNAGAKFSTADMRKGIIVDRACGLCVYSTDPDENTKHASIARLGCSILANRTMIEEEMRLLYVALTRACERLVIVGSVSSGKARTAGRGAGLSDFEVYSSRSYLDFLRPKNVIGRGEVAVVKPHAGQRVLTAKADKGFVQCLRKLFEKKYPYGTDRLVKTSVTALAGEGERKEWVESVSGGKGAEYGTAFHRAMQFGTAIDEASARGLEIVGEFVRGLCVYKEIVVMQEVDGVMVQGVIDLLGVGEGKVVIIDYKTTKASEAKLVEMYRGQLNLYRKAVEKVFGREVESWIYSSVCEKMIRC